MQDTQVLPVGLRLRWWGVAVVFGATFVGAYSLLFMLTTPAVPTFWGIPSGLFLIYLLGYARLNLRHNRRTEETPILSYLGVGNGLTLTRGLLYGLLAGFIAHPPSDGWWTVVPGVLYTTAALTDMADGYFARVRGETTRLGAKLDVEVDSLGILVATILAVQLGRIPTFFLALAGCYYLYQAGVSWRRSRGLPVYELPDSSWRRIVGGFQVGFLCVILWPVLPNSVTTLGGYVLAGPILFSFIRDWIAISRGPSSTPLTISSGLKPLFTNYLPVLLRIALVVSGIVFLTNAGAVVASLSLATFGVGILGLCSITLGAVGRFGALGWLVIGCAHAMQTGLTDLNSAIVAISLALMFLGTGAWSLWTPLDRLLMQPLGSVKQ